MWPLITVLALAATVAVYFFFVARLRRMRADYENELSKLREQTRDNTEKLQAQQRALLNSMTEGLLVLDDRNSIQLTNRALHRMFSLPDDIVGKTVLEAFRLHALAAIVDALKTQDTVLGSELELPAVHTDRNQWLQVNAVTVLDDDKRRLGAVLVFRDVTRLKQLESTRREFVANVSHELRTPLSMIKGYAETLLGGAINDADVSTRFLQTIERHSDRLATLINDLLVISELESGRITLNRTETAVRPLVDSVFQDLRARAQGNAIQLQNEIPENISVNADPDRLRQVLWNFIENAIKYGRKGGHVWIKATPSGPDLIEFSVRDDGSGIPAESLSRIFERFYRVDKARSREAGGTGLGLSIVKHIIQSHGGTVWVESDLGQGSTFYFTLKRR